MWRCGGEILNITFSYSTFTVPSGVGEVIANLHVERVWLCTFIRRTIDSIVDAQGQDHHSGALCGKIERDAHSSSTAHNLRYTWHSADASASARQKHCRQEGSPQGRLMQDHSMLSFG